MHFIRGWPWQPSWSRVVSEVSMSRRSSNRVVEQQSSSSNTTAPTDTPSGLSHVQAHQYVIIQAFPFTHFLIFFFLSTAASWRRNRTRLHARFWGSCSDAATGEAQKRLTNVAHCTKQKHGHTTHWLTLVAHWHLCPRRTGANSWCCFTVPAKPLDGP